MPGRAIAAASIACICAAVTSRIAASSEGANPV
jgi:hypothetical protein